MAAPEATQHAACNDTQTTATTSPATSDECLAIAKDLRDRAGRLESLASAMTDPGKAEADTSKDSMSVLPHDVQRAILRTALNNVCPVLEPATDNEDEDDEDADWDSELRVKRFIKKAMSFAAVSKFFRAEVELYLELLLKKLWVTPHGHHYACTRMQLVLVIVAYRRLLCGKRPDDFEGKKLIQAYFEEFEADESAEHYGYVQGVVRKRLNLARLMMG